MENGWILKIHKKNSYFKTYMQSQSCEQNKKLILKMYFFHIIQDRNSTEMIRDNILASSGLLVDKLGGPSVKPYQPEGLGMRL